MTYDEGSADPVPTPPSVSRRQVRNLAAVALLVAAGVGGWARLPADEVAPTAVATAPAPTPLVEGFSPATAPRPTYGDLRPATPVRLRVPSVGIDTAIVPLALSEDLVLEPPEDPALVGWWSESAEPGSRRGQTVITGHTVHSGGGAMDPLVGLRSGRTVDVGTEDGTMRYRVSRTEVVTRDELAARAQEIFGQDRTAGRLVLVTCTNWNGSLWEDNLLVYGAPLGRPQRT